MSAQTPFDNAPELPSRRRLALALPPAAGHTPFAAAAPATFRHQHHRPGHFTTPVGRPVAVTRLPAPWPSPQTGSISIRMPGLRADQRAMWAARSFSSRKTAPRPCRKGPRNRRHDKVATSLAADPARGRLCRCSKENGLLWLPNLCEGLEQSNVFYTGQEATRKDSHPAWIDGRARRAARSFTDRFLTHIWPRTRTRLPALSRTCSRGEVVGEEYHRWVTRNSVR